jgi:hypothetical protein
VQGFLFSPVAITGDQQGQYQGLPLDKDTTDAVLMNGAKLVGTNRGVFRRAVLAKSTLFSSMKPFCQRLAE